MSKEGLKVTTTWAHLTGVTSRALNFHFILKVRAGESRTPDWQTDIFKRGNKYVLIRHCNDYDY